MTAPSVGAVTKRSGAPYFVFVDHATNAIPATFDQLALPEDILETHIAYDIGAAAIGEIIARELNATLLTCDYSRLLIDPNRDVASKDVIPEMSDHIPIPRNAQLSHAERQARIDQFHAPYHALLAGELDTLQASHEDPLVISIHSFSPRLVGEKHDRPWHIGFLWKDDEASARALMKCCAITPIIASVTTSPMTLASSTIPWTVMWGRGG